MKTLNAKSEEGDSYNGSNQMAAQPRIKNLSSDSRRPERMTSSTEVIRSLGTGSQSRTECCQELQKLKTRGFVVSVVVKERR